jgi:hypothetical protein
MSTLTLIFFKQSVSDHCFKKVANRGCVRTMKVVPIRLYIHFKFSRVVRQNSHPRRPSIPDPNEEQIRTNARELIETVRNQTGLSYQVAQNTIHTVLSYVSTNFSRLDRNVPALLCELEQSSCELLKEPHDVAMSSDSKALESLFEELTRCKEDDQQRNWMLYEDESRIRDMLNHVCDRLQNAPRAASLHILKRFKYFYVNNLIEYFQMESRWPLRRPLVEAFILMCSLDPNIISIMLSSVLPLELVQDLYQTKVSKMIPKGNAVIALLSRVREVHRNRARLRPPVASFPRPPQCTKGHKVQKVCLIFWQHIFRAGTCI